MLAIGIKVISRQLKCSMTWEIRSNRKRHIYISSFYRYGKKVETFI